jgi:undecaprenyl-diphosphatase
MDVVMPFITEVKHFYPVYLLLFVWLFWRGGKNGLNCAYLLAVGIFIADPLNSQIIKEMVARIRPCHVLEGVRLLVPCGGGKSFPSTHAVNNVVAAVIISSFYPKSKVWAYSIAGLVAFSRVYVGVHYPSDIFGGAVEGALIALILLAVHKKIDSYFKKKTPSA